MSIIEKALGRQRSNTAESPVRPEPEREPEQNGATTAGAAAAVAPTTPPQGTAPIAAGEPVVMDLGRLRRHGIYPPPSMEHQIRDEYRRIKRPLLANATGRGAVAVAQGNLIMITSAMPGEGKTFTSVNLALSIARDPDFTVTLVDGDVARARTSRILGVQERPGLLDLLADERLQPSELILPTDVPSLSLLPAGRPHALSEELLSSDRMSRVLGQLGDASTHHILLFDSPPLLVSPEAVTLSSNVGQIVVVVKAAETLRHQVDAALNLLDEEKAINMVLNQSRGPAGGDYGSYYGYGYGYETER